MLISSNIQDLALARDTCVTIGNFDGVHAGHHALITWSVETAKRENLDFVLVTFWPHPRQVLPGREHKPLTTREMRMTLLQNLGVRKILEINFTPELAAMDAEGFTRLWLAPLRLRHLVVGHDFSLGHNREGTLDILQQLGRLWNFQVTRFPAVRINGEAVSSTRLRDYLEKGQVEKAASFLGRFPSICGEVGHGFGRGEGMGFPTANLDNIKTLLPCDGVYATFANFNSKRFPAVTNIGMNPTFAGEKRTVESFLLEGSPNLYNQALCLEFVSRLRSECQFASPQALIAQIKRDVQKAGEVLAKHTNDYLDCS